jgi:hypothetical protein
MNNLIFVAIVGSLIMLAQTNSRAQNKQNQLFLELGGNGLIYSVNYERLLSENLTLRGGLGYTPGLIFVEGTFFHIPVTMSYIVGGDHSKFEAGLGVTLFTGTNAKIFGLPTGDISILFISGILGYRYVSPSGFVWRIFVCPIYSNKTDPKFNPYGGMSFGFML